MKLNNIMSSLTSAYNEWSDILVNNSYIRRDQEISWANYKPVILPSIIHRSDVANLEIRKQYSFQIIDDGSIIQLYYLFNSDEETLARAKLAYYGASPLNGSAEDPFSSMIGGRPASAHDISTSLRGTPNDSYGLIPDDPVVPWLRIDYSPETQRGPLHHTCHMHIGLFQHARLPLSRVPSPQQFVESIIALCYPKHYKEKRFDDTWEPVDVARLYNLNTRCFPPLDGCVYDILPHIQIPTYQ